jgi:hypothetical protein
MWRTVREEFEQRRQYLVVILLGCIVTAVGVLLSLSSLRSSSSSNRFLGPIFVFSGFSAVLFGVRWRRTMLAAEQTEQIILSMGQLEQTYPPLSVTNNNNSRNAVLHQNLHQRACAGTTAGAGVGENKFLVAPPYSSVNYPLEPPPPYEPPDYQSPPPTVVHRTATTTSSTSVPTSAPYEPLTSINPSISTGTTPTLTYVQPVVSEVSQAPQQQWSETSPVVSQQP